MGKSMNGPDWADILTYAWDLEEQTGYEVVILTKSAGNLGGLPACVTVLGCRKGLAPWQAGGGLSVEATWPNRENKTLEGCVFAALARLDAAVRKQDLLDIILPP